MAWNKANKFKERQLVNDRPKTDSGIPTKMESNESKTLAEKAFRDLKYSGVISTKADPSTTASTASQPYAILARTNSVIDGVYPGEQNLNGNVITQLMNSTTSKLINNYDTGTLNLDVNYLYLCYHDKTYADAQKVSYAANIMMGNAINEALSRTNSEMLIQLPFSTYGVVTKLPQMDSNNLSYVVILYQTMLQNVAHILGKYVQLMSLEKCMIDMGFNREAYFTQSLFGLFKKKAFIQKLNALSTFIQGEYFDKDWYKQINTLTLVPSRKSNSVRDPLLTINSFHTLPQIDVYNMQGDDKTPGRVRLFGTSDYKANVTINGQTSSMTFYQICFRIVQLLDQNNVLTWARQNYSGVINESDQHYANEIIALINGLVHIMARFSADFNDTRTYLDRMNTIGLNNWSQGTFFDVSAAKTIDPSFNMIVANVFKAYLSSPDHITWDPTVMRWTFYSYWDEYTGLNTFDKYNGGAFLTFSVRNIQVPQGVEMGSTEVLVPKLFDIDEDSIQMTSRLGFQTTFTYEEIDHDEINDNFVLSRLLPFHSIEGTFRIPLVDVSQAGNVPAAASAAFEVMQTVFGIGRIDYTPSGQNPESNYAIDRDLISVLDFQMSDVSNAMISFCRAFAPFKVWIERGNRTIGFGN